MKFLISWLLGTIVFFVASYLLFTQPWFSALLVGALLLAGVYAIFMMLATIGGALIRLVFKDW